MPAILCDAMIDLGGPFGASAIIGSMQGRHGPDQSLQITMEYLGESLQQLGQHAASNQVPLIYEPFESLRDESV